MEKDLSILDLKIRIQNTINNLDKNKIHILYFSYYFNFHNLYRNPLMIVTKIYNLLVGKKSIDHVAHISRFIYDEENKSWSAKIFEATMERGMEQNDLFDKLKSFQGTCYIETINKVVNKDKARNFEKTYTGVPYSKVMAILSGLDITDTILQPKPNNGGFCSWLESLFLKNQNIKINHIQSGNEAEITPSDLYCGNLGKKSMLFKY